MNPPAPETSGKLTVVVFKDNDAARTFLIPLQWISRLGLILALFSLLALCSMMIGIKYYRLATRSDPLHVQDLEHEVSDLKATLRKLEGKSNSPAETHSARNSIHSDSQVQEAPSSNFLLFPKSIQNQLPDPSTLPFSIQTPTFNWEGKLLKVRFAIQYIKNDGGNHQGKILLLARGPDTLLAYPNGILNDSGNGSLISPEKGEFFSVSRFREVKAEFGPVQSKNSLQEVEIFIFDKSGQLLFERTLKVGSE
jgi:hypothetical protein